MTNTIITPMQNNQALKRLLPEHLSAVAEVERACFSTPWSENALRILTEEPHVGFVFERDGMILGYGGMQCVLDEGQITDIAVLPEHRRQGIAASLLTALIDHARAVGLRVIYLEVRESNIPALSLYRDRFGFEVIGVRKNFYSQPRENAYNMQLILPDIASETEGQL